MSKHSGLWGILFLSIIGIFIIKRHLDGNKLIYNHAVVCGTITGVSSSKGGNTIGYNFIFNGEKIEDSGGGCTDETKEKYYKGMDKILIVISKKDPSIYRLLQNSDDYEKFNVIREDTIGVLCTPTQR